MNSVNIGDNVENRTCLHRHWVKVSYIANDPGAAPVLAVEGCAELTIISLTNQVIRVSCPYCFEKIRAEVTRLV